MLTDRTYLLFKPRNTLTSERLNIKPDQLNHTINSSTYHRSFNKNGLFSGSNTKLNSLHHSSSYERLNLDQYNSTPVLGRKLASNLTSNHDYSNSYFSLPRRKTNTLSVHTDNPHLYRSDSFNSSFQFANKTSSNMEKREMLMSAFNRHTNVNNYTNSLNSFTYNRLKNNNLLNSNYVLPPRPNLTYNNYNFKKTNCNYSSSNRNFLVNYLNYDDYFRPKIRDRPLFAEIRKSIMIKSNQHYNSNLVNKNLTKNKYLNTDLVHKNSVLSNGSSLSRSSSSSESLFVVQNESTATSSPSDVSAVNSPLQSQKSIRKVDRFRSVIKFREHNIGKTYAERKNQINWNLDYDADEFVLNLLKNQLKEGESIDEKLNQIKLKKDLNEKFEDVWNVVTDTTLPNNSSSTLSELDLNCELINNKTESLGANQIFLNQFAKFNDLNEQKKKLKLIETNQQNLEPGKLKLHKSVNLSTSDELLNKASYKHSKSVKIDLNRNQIEGELPSEIKDDHHLNGESKKFGQNIKKIIKTATKPFTFKKTNKVKIKENKIILNDKDQSNEVNIQEIESELNLKDVQDEDQIFITYLTQNQPKTAYFNENQEFFKVNHALKNFKTSYKKPIQLETKLNLNLIKTDYYFVDANFVTNATSALIRTKFHYFKYDKIEVNLNLVKTEYFKVGPNIVNTKHYSDLIQTKFNYPINQIHTITDLIRTEFIFVPNLITFKELKSSKTSYFYVPNQIVNCKTPFIITDYIKPSPELFITELNLNNLDLLEFHQPTLLQSNQAINLKKLQPNSSLNQANLINENLIKTNLSLNETKLNQESKLKKPKSIKIKKIKKIKKSSRENSLEDQTIDLIYNNKLNSKSNSKQTFQKQKINRQTKSNRIVFRKYNVNDFSFQSVLGRGSFGKVFLAELIGHDTYFAIKCLKKNVVIEDNDVESTMIERKVLALGSSNPFICKLFCTFQTSSYLCFVMEYLAGGDLMFHVQKVGRFTEDRARFYAAEIVCALKFLHRRYIIYRDLKLDNILLDKDGHIRLVDFGMCQCKIYRQECLPSNFCGTPDYMAPEIIKGIKYNHSVDWWSFGVLLYEMLIGKSPFTGADEDELLWNVCNEKIIFPMFLSKDAVHMIALLLNRNPEKRLGMPGCPANDINHQMFFEEINWDLANSKRLVPPFVPDLIAANDISNFDKEFTEAEPHLTPIEQKIVNDLDHNLFDGFSYTNPNMTE